MALRHVFTITTNRPIGDAISGYAAEVMYIQRRTGSEVPWLVVEDGFVPAAVTAENLAAVRTAAAARSARIVYLTRAQVVAALNGLTADETIKEVLASDDVNYGRGFNITSLLAAAYGADVIHRRDSDTSLVDGGDEQLFPSRIELDHCGQQHGVWKTKVLPVSLVGGNYFGPYNMNVQAFAGREDLLREVFELMFIPDAGKDHIIKVQIPAGGVRPLGDTVVQTHGQVPDMGNVAFTRDLFESIAVPVHAQTPGLDYFFISALMNLGECVLLHNANVEHRQQGSRSTLEYQRGYWVRKAGQLDAMHFYREVFRRAGGLSFWQFRDEMPSLLKAVHAEKGALLSVRRICWQRLVDIFEHLAGEVGQVVAADLRQSAASVFDRNEHSLDLHIRLQSAWQDLVGRAKTVRSQIERIAS